MAKSTPFEIPLNPCLSTCQNVVYLFLKYVKTIYDFLKQCDKMKENGLGERYSMKIGYVRVSSKDQNEARQIEALEAYCEKLYVEKVSGKDTNRPELKAMLGFVREGDTIYMESISRLARNTLDFLQLVKELTERGVTVVSLKETLDTSTPQGKFMLTVFGALYELERDNIKERQAEGIAVAQKNGVKFGRPKQAVTDQFITVYKQWKQGDIKAVEAMRLLDLKANTFYRRVKECEAKQ